MLPLDMLVHFSTAIKPLQTHCALEGPHATVFPHMSDQGASLVKSKLTLGTLELRLSMDPFVPSHCSHCPNTAEKLSTNRALFLLLRIFALQLLHM